MVLKKNVALYVLYVYKIAYYKAHYPLEFYCAYFSTFADEFDSFFIEDGKIRLKLKYN